MAFPTHRMRRLRVSEPIRRLVRETRLSVDELVMPMFVVPGAGRAEPIGALPGQFRYSADRLVAACGQAHELGVPAVLLFGVPDAKDDVGSGAWDDEGVIQQAVRAVKRALPELVVICDLCFCEYTTHGHCGVLLGSGSAATVDNDATLGGLARAAASLAHAGADIVAPSDMMDGRVAAIRRGLDEAGFVNTAIMSYSAKHASAFYGPFRAAAGSAPAFGDRRSYQMDPANGDEAVREAATDIEEGADIVMVKPAGPCLDLVWRIKRRFAVPTAAYQVSGEYAMLKAAAAAKAIDERPAVLESLTAIKRAGADLIVTYYAADAARWIEE